MGIGSALMGFTPQGRAAQAGGMALQLVTGICAIIFIGVCMGWVMEKSKGKSANQKKLGDLQRTTMAFCIMTMIFGLVAYFAKHAMNSF